MKKVILAVIALTAFAANAQDGFKGKWFLMGQVNFSSTVTPKTDLTAKTTTSSFTVLPAVGTFIAPTTAVGLAIGYTGESAKADGGDKVNGGTFIVQPLARKYWGVTDNFLLFGEAAVPLKFAKYGEAKASSVGVNVGVGMDYFITGNWSVEAKLGVLGWESAKPKGGDATTTFGLDVNSGLLNGLSLGVKYVF
ncbi:porin family protein [Paenimyroides tangerinum]|uniref:Porin family protein n=1 Tax=Paenimyroides tangerinum TaxID=2488728 RepID=A0A3P3WHX8_9FLAO|nr:outer membrane beta-barrel protein [Paenimyroides tangerinum]RRJ88957.1 porin family protein [Paenimyroides tangerinum]RRJ92333.1 porin family protein [Paenimyroides tangerinum]